MRHPEGTRFLTRYPGRLLNKNNVLVELASASPQTEASRPVLKYLPSIRLNGPPSTSDSPLMRLVITLIACWEVPW